MTDLLFIHSTPYDPLNPMWAGYNGVQNGTDGIDDLISSTGGPNCYLASDGYTLSAGNITTSGDLCSTNLYINPADRDGTTNCSTGFQDVAWGPAWSMNNTNGCPLDDPGLHTSLGPNGRSIYRSTERYGYGFGRALGLNTTDYTNGDNYIWMLVR